MTILRPNTIARLRDSLHIAGRVFLVTSISRSFWSTSRSQIWKDFVVLHDGCFVPSSRSLCHSSALLSPTRWASYSNFDGSNRKYGGRFGVTYNLYISPH